ncbi:MAG: NlpC/P60 family protein [Arcanobacterium sp.]|nr:NlpC/P60 family protein [Arcanobacterium sp.]
MAGRHLRTAVEVNTLAKNGAKGLAAASLLGVIAGVTAPIANAATDTAAKNSTSANAAVGTEVKDAVLAVPTQAKVEILKIEEASTTPAWSISEVQIEAKEAPKPVETTASTAGQSETGAAETQVASQATAGEAQAAATVTQTTTGTQTDAAAETETAVPASSGASAVVAAALAQLGEAQDCTRLVWDSLVAAGYASGAKTVGTGIWQYDRFGSRVSLSALQPGDILVYGNASSGAHVAIYIGNGKAVHGGWNGYTTAIGPVQVNKPLTGAVRPGA